MLGKVSCEISCWFCSSRVQFDGVQRAVAELVELNRDSVGCCCQPEVY